MNSLFFSESTITDVSNTLDSRGNSIVRISTKGSYCNTMLDLYPYDVKYLSQMLGCDILDIKGKKVTGVSNGSRIFAVGYQGMYIKTQLPGEPFTSSRIYSELELCSALNCDYVVRYDSDGKQIAKYEVPINRERTNRL